MEDYKKSIVGFISDNFKEKAKRDEKNRKIKELYELGFTVQNPSGTKQLHSKLLVQAISQLSSMMKFLDFDLKCQNVESSMEMVVTDSISTILDVGGLDDAVRDKGGVFFNQLMYGDGYFTVDLNENEKERTEVPIVFKNYINSNIILDKNATKIRNRSGNSVKRAMVYSSFTLDEAKGLFDIGDAKGKLPRSNEALADLDKDNDSDDSNIIEIGYYFDVSKKKYYVVAGSELKLLEEKTDEEYPFILDGVPYIPIFDFLCIPSAEGIYNHGIGDYVYELAIINQRLKNLGIGHAYKNTNPIPIVNLPQGKAGRFFKSLDDATRLSSQGADAYAVVEYDPANPGASSVNIQSNVTQALINEWQVLFDGLVNELKRMGINIDAVDRGANTTATQIISEEEAKTAFVKQMMEYNASETQILVRVVLQLFKDNVSKNNETPINTKIKLADGTEVSNITYGDIVDELSRNKYYVNVNSRTGAIPSNIMRQTVITRLLQGSQPGTPTYAKLMKEFFELNDHEFALEDFGEQQQKQELPQQQPTMTDVNATNVRSKELIPAI